VSIFRTLGGSWIAVPNLPSWFHYRLMASLWHPVSVCSSLHLVTRANCAQCSSSTLSRSPLTSLHLLLAHTQMMLLCCSFTSASLISMNPSNGPNLLTIWILKYIRSAEPRLWPHPVVCLRNNLWKGTLDRGCTVFPHFFQLVLSPVFPMPSLLDLFRCRFLEPLLVATACWCYFRCQAWHTRSCFLAFL